MVDLTVQNEEDVVGGLPTFTPSDAEGVRFANDGETVIWVQNTHATLARAWTAIAGKPMECGFHHDYPAAGSNEDGTAPALATVLSPVFLPARFNDNQGRVVVTFDDFTTINVAAVRKGTAGRGGIVYDPTP